MMERLLVDRHDANDDDDDDDGHDSGCLKFTKPCLQYDSEYIDGGDGQHGIDL